MRSGGGLEGWFGEGVRKEGKSYRLGWGKSERGEGMVVKRGGEFLMGLEWVDDEEGKRYFEVKME